MIEKYMIELLSKKEVKYLKKLILRTTETNEVKKKHKEIHERILQAVDNHKFIPIDEKKINRTKIASAARTQTVIKKIKKGLKILKKKNTKPTIANVTTTAKIAYGTSKKYADMFGYEKKEESI